MNLKELQDFFGPHYEVHLEDHKMTLERVDNGGITYRKAERELTDEDLNRSAWDFFNTIGSEMVEQVHNPERSTEEKR